MIIINHNTIINKGKVKQRREQAPYLEIAETKLTAILIRGDPRYIYDGENQTACKTFQYFHFGFKLA